MAKPLRMSTRTAIAIAICVAMACARTPERVLTFSGSLVGREGDVIRRQLERFQRENPSISVALRATPDAADQRHQLYVQWLNARATDPDVLQLDVVWTAEFAAAGWIESLDRFHPAADQFFERAVASNRWRGALYALPWFIDVGMLYWRTDLLAHAPRDLAELSALAVQAQHDHHTPFGYVWQGARYEGLVTVFLEQLGAFGGSILDDEGRVLVDSEAAVNALTWMRDMIYDKGVTPEAVLTWQEEQVRFAFENGEAAMMRNWPYAYPLLQDPAASRVAGRFAVAPVPGGPGGTATAALGGSELAINAFSEQPEAAYQLIDYLLQPAQMIERARIAGQLPPRPSLYHSDALADVLEIQADDARRIIERAIARPVTPVYSELSQLLQVSLHRALTRQQDPRSALQDAAGSMRRLLVRAQLAPPP
jgi:ABC-type glycerol-3-phosphate transport system substrate-binding protein